jgi:signal transduction histidine kinase/CheY-like chemotaxis protein
MMNLHTGLFPAKPHGIQSTLRELQEETIALVLPALFVAGLALVAVSRHFRNPFLADVGGLILMLLPVAVWGLRKLDHLAAAWALALGCLAVTLLVATWGEVGVALCLLSVPVGLAALFVSVAGGVLTAGLCSALLLYAPAVPAASDAALRVTAILGLWSAVGLIWLTLRPLLTALAWSWSSYEQSRTLLEQARDTQVQLKQALADLADANLQLTRLNHLAQGLRQAAEGARRAKEQFAANVSHELRTPLNMIIGFCEMIVQAPRFYGRRLPPTLLADLSIVLRNSQHLSSLIDDVLDLSQIEVGRMSLTKERVALSEVIDAAVIAVEPLIASKGLYLETEVPPDLVLSCDRTRIRQVVLNLLSNAARFTEQGGVRICAWREDNDLLIAVADSGPGIAAEGVARLFEPFQQLGGSIRRHHGGSGLGLSISKSFVELHGGKIWLESKEGVGTTFYIRLPIYAPAPLNDRGGLRWLSPYTAHEERPWRPSARAVKVRSRLVVLESGDALQRLLRRYLPDAELARVTSLDEALAELSRVPAQALVVNDLSVPEALLRLASTGLPEGTPTIICSVSGTTEAAGALGVADYLVKPITRERLLTALNRLPIAGQTVLVVDDDLEVQLLLRRMLASSGRGYRVLRAEDGREALGILRQERPDAILLDLVMPGMDGFRFLAARSEEPDLRDIPVIAISARDPVGQQIVSPALAVTRSGGLSAPQILDCIGALSKIVGAAGGLPDMEKAATAHRDEVNQGIGESQEN